MKDRRTIYVKNIKLPKGQMPDGSIMKPYQTIQEALDSVIFHQITDFISMTIDDKKKQL